MQAINDCDVVICIVSKNFLRSPWVVWEVETGIALGRRLFPIVLDDTSEADFPGFLMPFHCIRFDQSKIESLESFADHVSSEVEQTLSLCRLDAKWPSKKKMNVEANSSIAVSGQEEFVEIIKKSGIALYCSSKGNNELIRIGYENFSLMAERHIFPGVSSLSVGQHKSLIGHNGMVTEFARSAGDQLVWVPQRTFHLSGISIGDIDSDGDAIFLVNATYSCISRINGQGAEEYLWWPDTISALVAEDRCRISGMALCSGNLRIVTMFSESDYMRGWRDGDHSAGAILDVTGSQPTLRGIMRPRFPRLIGSNLWFAHNKNSISFFPLGSQSSFNIAVDKAVTTGLYISALKHFEKHLVVALSIDRAVSEGGDASGARQPSIVFIDTITHKVSGVAVISGDLQEINDLAIINSNERFDLSFFRYFGIS